MGKISRQEKEKILRRLKRGQTLVIVRDLSQGRMEENMIQKLSIRVSRRNYKSIRRLLFDYPILEVKILNY